MSNIQSEILTFLREGAASCRTIALQLGRAESSIRRDIQALRRLGHNINDARDDNGQYRLVA